MALYLDEVWLKDPSPERMKEFVRLIGSAAKNPASVGAPQEVRFAGGPWFSKKNPRSSFWWIFPTTPRPFRSLAKSSQAA